MARWKDKVHRTSENKAQSTRTPGQCAHMAVLSQHLGAEDRCRGGSLQGGPVVVVGSGGEALKVENFKGGEFEGDRTCHEQGK